MTGITVAGAKIRLAPVVPTGITKDSTDAERVAVYESAAFVEPASCIVTALPVFKEMWATAQDEDTICDNEDEIKDTFKTVLSVDPSSFAAIFEKSDPLIILAIELRKSRTDVGLLEITHSNGVDKVWAEIEINSTSEDLTAVLGKVKFTAEFFFKKKPVRN